MIERVLLSPDLVPAILGPLEAEDGAAAAVCSQWLAGWNATNEPRRRLKQVPLDFPEEFVTDEMPMAATPDGRLVVCDGSEQVRILDRSMRVLQTVACKSDEDLIAASDESIFHCVYEWLHRSSHDGTLAAEYQLEGYGFHCPVLAPGGLLFCVIFIDGDPDQDEIIALDAQTLQLRHRFGLGLLNDAQQLAVVGEELFVCDAGNHRLQVFSLTGEHRRSVTGAWKSPMRLCFAKDRLYLVEQERDGNEDEDEFQGHRLLVLSLQGDLLQVVTHPTEPTAVFSSICCFDRKLLASYWYRGGEPAPGARWKYGVLALQGL